MDTLLVLLPGDADPMAIGRALAASDAARRIVAYLPLDVAPSTRHGLPPAASFSTAVELTTDSAEATRRALDSAAIGNSFVYRVEERCLPPSAEGGVAPTPRVVLVAPVCRASGVDPAGFAAHWRDVHGPLALQHHVGMCDYRQALVVERLSPGAPPFDGIARLGFPTLHDFETRFFDSKEGRRAIAEDTRRFVALDRSEAELLRRVAL